MVSRFDGKGFALLCDSSDCLRNWIRSEYDLDRVVRPGDPVFLIFDEACREKVVLFLDEVRARGIAFNWELVVLLPGGPASMNFASVRMEDRILIVGAETRHSTIRLMEEMLKLNTDQSNQLRRLMKDFQVAASQQEERDRGTYSELTRLNNQLAVMQRELINKNHALAQLDQQKNYFLGMAAHDLRAPLATIVSYCEYLMDTEREHTEEEDLELVRTIRKSSEFMLALIDDLLDISKIESGHLHLNRQPVRLPEFLAGAVRTNLPAGQKKGIEIRQTADGLLPEAVDWDYEKMQQVMNNLIGNAVKFSHPDGTVTVRVSAGSSRLEIRVEDQGDGLPEEVLEQLFQPFSKGSRLGTQGEKGTGLGLAIARRIVEAHGGTIGAENIPDGGTRFVVCLPLPGPGSRADSQTNPA